MRRYLLAAFAFVVAILLHPPQSSLGEETILFVGGGGGVDECASPAYADIGVAVAAAPSGAVVHLCPGTYYPPKTIVLGPKDLTIEGDGRESSVVDGSDSHQVFDATGQVITFMNVTVQNGFVADRSGGAVTARDVHIVNSNFSSNTADQYNGEIGGGAIHSTGMVSVTNSIFRDNYTVRRGAAIWVTSRDPVTVTGSVFENNRADYGGALYIHGDLTVSKSSFLQNGANGGGAIVVERQATITQSAFEHNTSINEGAGALSVGGFLTVANSTFVENASTYPTPSWGGGAIRVGSSGSIANSTFVDNTAAFGGTLLLNPGANLTISNALLRSSSGNACWGSDFIDGGGNLVTDTSCGFGLAVTDAQLALGELADNGGDTETVALLTGSIAIDAGVDAICGAVPVSGFDQRSEPRPQGSHCDSGAFEAANEGQDSDDDGVPDSEDDCPDLPGTPGDGGCPNACSLTPTIIGTQGNDLIVGTPGNDVIRALGGNDTIYGVGGNDVVCAGNGNDRIQAGSGDDSILTGDGNDDVDAGDGDNTVDTGAGNDIVSTGAGSDSISTADGNDDIRSGAGSDVVFAGAGNDRIDGGLDVDTCNAGSGNNQLLGCEL